MYEFLRLFTSPFWAVLSILIILAGVLFPKWAKKGLFAIGSVMLIPSALFSGQMAQTVIQVMCSFAGFMQLSNAKKEKKRAILLIVLLIGIIFLLNQKLLVFEMINGFGMIFIAICLVEIPEKIGFLAGILGSIILAIGNYLAGAWTFLILNLIFIIVNGFSLLRTSPKSTI